MTADTDREPHTPTLADTHRSVLGVFVELADTLVEDYDLQDFLFGLLTHCTRLFDAPSAGIMLRTPRGGVELVPRAHTWRSTSSCSSCRSARDRVWSA